MDIVVSNRIVQKPNISVIGDNADYTVNFHFDSEWDGIVKTARFERKNGEFADVVLVDDSCEIPVQVLKRGYLKVGVYSEKMTTTYAEIYVNESIKERGGIPKQPAYDVYAQILEKIDKLKGSGVDKETLKEIVSEETRKYIAENGIEVDTSSVNEMVETYIEEHKEELKGTNGITPHIGENGNWFIGDRDTGQSAGGSGGGLSHSEVEQIVDDKLGTIENTLASIVGGDD